MGGVRREEMGGSIKGWRGDPCGGGHALHFDEIGIRILVVICTVVWKMLPFRDTKYTGISLYYLKTACECAIISK